MRVRAFAKINLSLRVLGTRPDGYHELQTIYQSIGFCDTLVIRRARGRFRLTCDDRQVPVDRRNLVWRAADAVWTAAGRRGRPHGVAVHLVKRIPIEAGLGGGSSDAAAALRAFARLWRVDSRKLGAIASELGADVPYFLEGGTVLGRGRGDILFPLPDEKPAWVTLIVPSFGVSTTDAYKWWDQRRSSLDRSTGSRSSRAPSGDDKLRTTGESSSLAPGLSKGERVNDLQPVVAERHPEISRLVAALRGAGARNAAMSGSGSAVFGLFARRSDASRAGNILAARAWRVLLGTRTLTRAECRRLVAK